MYESSVTAASPIPDLSPDGELSKRVALYLANTRNELSALAISSIDGVVGLQGTVSSFYLRQLAVACARRVAGVRGVVDELQVDYGGGGSGSHFFARQASRELLATS
jgi:osmotically-inducible protein OsmY